jgi:hypothetical protein
VHQVHGELQVLAHLHVEGLRAGVLLAELREQRALQAHLQQRVQDKAAQHTHLQISRCMLVFFLLGGLNNLPFKHTCSSGCGTRQAACTLAG